MDAGKDTLYAGLNNSALRFKISLKNIRAPMTVLFPDQPENTGLVSLNENSLRQVENSFWSGQFSRCLGGAPGIYELRFGAGNDIWPESIITTLFPATKYTRQGASIRYTYILAGVRKTEYLAIMPDNTIAGVQIADGAIVGNFKLSRKP